MNKFIIAIVVFFMVSCDQSAQEKYEENILSNIDPRIILIDSCEYYAFQFRYTWQLEHKGNCKNHK